MTTTKPIASMTDTEQEKTRAYNREWYHRNKGDGRIWETKRMRRAAIAVWFQEVKSQLSCSRCGESDPACIDFHHQDASNKEVNISDAVKQGWSRERILAEVAKCEPVCANCHRKLHAGSIQ